MLFTKNQEEVEKLTKKLEGETDSKNHASIFNLRGEAYMKMAKYEDALKDFTSAIENDATNSNYFTNRSEVNQQLGEHKASREDYEKAIKLVVGDKSILYGCGGGNPFVEPISTLIRAAASSSPIHDQKAEAYRAIITPAAIMTAAIMPAAEPVDSSMSLTKK